MRVALGSLAAVVLGSCAQTPTRELEMTSERVEAARAQDAPVFAPEPFFEAESFLEEAKRLVAEEGEYGTAIQAMALASLRADEAFFRASAERIVVLRRLDRIVLELQGLLEMAEARGAAAEAAPELASLRARYEEVRRLAASRDLLDSLDRATTLKPELLELERKLRD